MDGGSCERTMHFVLEQRVKKPFLARTLWGEMFWKGCIKKSCFVTCLIYKQHQNDLYYASMFLDFF